MEYQREKDGIKTSMAGMDLAHPVDRITKGRYAAAVNVRNYIPGATVARNALSAPIYTLPYAPHSMRRLNDSTPNGPAAGYTTVLGANTNIYVGAKQVAQGLSGNQVSLIPFRPNTSVQPWMYVGDNSPQGSVELFTKSLYSGAAINYFCSGLIKVRSDGTAYKTGIMEPQTAPVVGTQNVTVNGSDVLAATSIPWTNVGGQNSSYAYGETNSADGTPPVIITGGAATLIAGSTINLTVSGTANINGATHAPNDTGPTGTTYPGQFATSTPTLVVAAFTDADGNVLPVNTTSGGQASVFPVGTGVSATVPANAVQLQVGINSARNTFSQNSGSFNLAWAVTINPIAKVVSTLGNVTAYVWGTPPPNGGGSPHSGPVALYIWKNPGDTGSGTARSISDPVPDASPTNNSWHFDSSPEDGTVPVNWQVLNSDGSVSSTIPLFEPALETEGYQDFNACICGSLFVPAAGTHTFSFAYKDQIMVGISGGSIATANPTGPFGQTVSVVNKLPLVFVGTANGSGGQQTGSVAVTFAEAGVYQVEVDWDYWEHTGRSMIMQVDGAVIPPIAANVRQAVQYRYVYRSSATGAQSNPSPESTAQAVPVVANSVTSAWSSDPQVDLVDYYRLDENVSSFTYVATGPNDGSGGSTNTPIVDLTEDTALGNQLLSYDNYEPFPSIDLPQKGTVNISGGTLTWVSGGAIGGTSTRFNPRWLAGTVILLGSPTAVPYTMVARPLNAETIVIPGVPDGTNVQYVINEPALAAQPLPYLFGPTDNVLYTFAVGDPLRPGTLYWCDGNNLDVASNSNQIEVTDPSEPLVNGCISSGRAVLFSIRRAWVIEPEYASALATATGIEGDAFYLQETPITRGLFIPRCLAVEGGGTIFFRVDDGIHASPGGGGSRSITDDDLYPLFSHEGSTPQPVVRGTITVYPPDDTQPNQQRFSVDKAYLYYDYVGTDGYPHTLVYDIAAGGWVLDAYQWPATVHAASEGVSKQGTMVGCTDGSVRQFSTTGVETAAATVLPPSWDKGDMRADGHWGDVWLEVGTEAR